MQRLIFRISIIAVVLLLIVMAIFWGRISGSFMVYRTVSEITNSLNQGDDNLNFNVSARWGDTVQRDSLLAMVYYTKDTLFLADVRYNDKRFMVYSNKNQTSVDVFHQNLKIIGSGENVRNFDLLLLSGKILQNHSEFRNFLALNWIERVGIAFWSFFNCDFKEGQDKSIAYEIVVLPKKLVGSVLELWVDDKEEKYYRVVLQDSVLSLQAKLTINSNPEWDTYHPQNVQKNLMVNRSELNTAIYRGALRTAGILLENAVNPTVDGKAKSWGKGKLIFIDDNRVFLAGGTNREIGEAHGALLKNEIHKMVDATLYTVGWVYTLDRGTWFLDDMRGAYNRLEPYIPEKYQEEMAGLSETSGISLEEVHLTNVFPALFHCSGFALFNQSTLDGKLYHGRILDYMTQIGLQYNAVVFILNPDGGYAHANIGYAGFIGSVSGMNEHQVAFGEMGGRGEGEWDGMPMPFLMREGLEQAKTLEQALTIFRNTARTCEYYYVISDGKIPDARGLATTAQKFEIIKPNQFHELLPHPMEDAVLMSGRDRYEKLVERVHENYGKINVEKALRLMDRPVAMKSNLHDVLFAPQTLEFWVANAGSGTPACNEPYTHYSLSDLLAGMR